MTDARFEMVVSAIDEDGFSDDYGIKGELTAEQREILLAAAGSRDGTCDEVWVAAAIIDQDVAWLTYIEGDRHRAEDVTEHFLDPEQITKLTADNWPKYPVLTSTFMRWC